MLAWLRRIIVSLGVGGTSYTLMLAFMVASVVYDRELEPVVTFACEIKRHRLTALPHKPCGGSNIGIAIENEGDINAEH